MAQECRERGDVRCWCMVTRHHKDIHVMSMARNLLYRWLSIYFGTHINLIHRLMSKYSDKLARKIASRLVEAGLVRPEQADGFIDTISAAVQTKPRKRNDKK